MRIARAITGHHRGEEDQHHRGGKHIRDPLDAPGVGESRPRSKRTFSRAAHTCSGRRPPRRAAAASPAFAALPRPCDKTTAKHPSGLHRHAGSHDGAVHDGIPPNRTVIAEDRRSHDHRAGLDRDLLAENHRTDEHVPDRSRTVTVAIRRRSAHVCDARRLRRSGRDPGPLCTRRECPLRIQIESRSGDGNPPHLQALSPASSTTTSKSASRFGLDHRFKRLRSNQKMMRPADRHRYRLRRNPRTTADSRRVRSFCVSRIRSR